MALSNGEIKDLIEKLKGSYKEYGEKYSPKWFDLDKFNERYLLAIRKGMNLEGFILAEISDFEKLKDKYEKTKKAKENTFLKKVDQIIDDNLARIKKYPKIVFDQSCSVELAHFYGAIYEYTFSFFPILWYLMRDHNTRQELSKIEEILEAHAMSGLREHPRRIEDHILLINRPDIKEIDIEKDKNDYLRECAFVLHEVVELCNIALEMKMEEWNYPINFSRLNIEATRKKAVVDNFGDTTGYGAIMKVRDLSLEIISDFRLGAFKRKF